MTDHALAVCLDSVDPLERVKLTSELAAITKKVAAEISPIDRVKAAKRMSDIIALLTGVSDVQDDELSDDPNSPNYRYKDTGYIADSRKELAQNMIFTAKKDGKRVRATDIDWDAIEQNPRQAADLVTKSNLFGKTDWTALQESGMDPAAGFLIDKIYASIGPEPTAALPTATVKALARGTEELKSIDQLDRTSAEALAQTRKDYAVGLETIRDRLENRKTVDEVVGVIEDIRDELMGVQLSASQADEVAKLHALHEEKRGIAKTMQAEQDRVYQAWNRAQMEHRSAQYEQEKRERRKWKPDPVLDAKVRELELAVEQAHSDYENFRADHPEMQSQKREYASGGFNYLNDLEYEAYQVYLEIKAIERQAKMFNLMSNQVTRAWLTFGERFMKLVNYRSYRGSDSFAGHVTNAKAGKIKDWSWADKERPTKVKGATASEIRFQMKVADSYQRKGGRDIKVNSTAELKEMLGFREIQSGNWVLKDPNSAKFHVEQTAAAMSDMADILGIDMKLLGYGGRLGMAFGARGTGGKNAARAHYEPVHRVINLTKMGGGGSLGHEWFHSMDNILHEMVNGKPGEKGQFISSNPALLPPGKLRDAITGVWQSMHNGEVRAAAVHKYTGKDVQQAKLNVDRVTRNKLPLMIKAAGNPTKAVNDVNDYLNGYRENKKQRTAWTRIAVAYYHEGEANDDETYTVKLKTGAFGSSFMAEAVKMDEGVQGKYWSQTEEMAARAFQAYIEDKLADADRRNDYLSAMADNKFYFDPLTGEDFKPFPEGEERKRLNAAFDKLFASIREEKVFERAVADDKLMDSIFHVDDGVQDEDGLGSLFDASTLDVWGVMDSVEAKEKVIAAGRLAEIITGLKGASGVDRDGLLKDLAALIREVTGDAQTYSNRSNAYKKIGSDWGAWIDTGYGRSAIPKPKPGSLVTVYTRSGEAQQRIVKGVHKDYASGVIVTLLRDEDIAAKAQQRYQDKVAESAPKPSEPVEKPEKDEKVDPAVAPIDTSNLTRVELITTKGNRIRLDLLKQTLSAEASDIKDVNFTGPTKATLDGKVVQALTIPQGKVGISDADADKLHKLFRQVAEYREQELDALMPGLSLMRKTLFEEDRYMREFNRMMEDEGNDGVFSPDAPPKVNSSELAKQYPKAALYIEAENYSNASHADKAAAGRKAKRILASGGSEEEARAVLNNWLDISSID